MRNGTGRTENATRSQARRRAATGALLTPVFLSQRSSEPRLAPTRCRSSLERRLRTSGKAAIFWRGCDSNPQACEGPAAVRSDDYHVTASYTYISGYLAGPGKLRKAQNSPLSGCCKSTANRHLVRAVRPQALSEGPDDHPVRDVTQLFEIIRQTLDERYKDRRIAELRSHWVRSARTPRAREQAPQA